MRILPSMLIDLILQRINFVKVYVLKTGAFSKVLFNQSVVIFV